MNINEAFGLAKVTAATRTNMKRLKEIKNIISEMDVRQRSAANTAINNTIVKTVMIDFAYCLNLIHKNKERPGDIDSITQDEWKLYHDYLTANFKINSTFLGMRLRPYDSIELIVDGNDVLTADSELEAKPMRTDFNDRTKVLSTVVAVKFNAFHTLLDHYFADLIRLFRNIRKQEIVNYADIPIAGFQSLAQIVFYGSIQQSSPNKIAYQFMTQMFTLPYMIDWTRTSYADTAAPNFGEKWDSHFAEETDKCVVRGNNGYMALKASYGMVINARSATIIAVGGTESGEFDA